MIVEDERARAVKMKYFHDLSLKLRLPLAIDVYVSSEENIRLQFIKTFSADADLVFTTLKQPEDATILEENYPEYLRKISKFIENNSNVVLLLSSDHTPLDSILS